MTKYQNKEIILNELFLKVLINKKKNTLTHIHNLISTLISKIFIVAKLANCQT